MVVSIHVHFQWTWRTAQHDGVYPCWRGVYPTTRVSATQTQRCSTLLTAALYACILSYIYTRTQLCDGGVPVLRHGRQKHSGAGMWRGCRESPPRNQTRNPVGHPQNGHVWDERRQSLVRRQHRKFQIVVFREQRHAYVSCRLDYRSNLLADWG